MTATILLAATLPGFPDMRLCSASDCRWLIAFMATFLVVLIGLLALAVFFQIRDRLDRGPGRWR